MNELCFAFVKLHQFLKPLHFIMKIHVLWQLKKAVRMEQFGCSFLHFLFMIIERPSQVCRECYLRAHC